MLAEACRHCWGRACLEHDPCLRNWPGVCTKAVWGGEAMYNSHLSSGGVLCNKAHEGEHGQAAVLDLLQLVSLQGLRSRIPCSDSEHAENPQSFMLQDT